MALSDYDTLAIDLNSNPTNGVFTTPLGVIARIYKNWIYVTDEGAWREGDPFIDGVVMQIQHGELRYRDLHVFAKRGPKNGIYAVLMLDYGDNTQGMVCIGCCSYTSTTQCPNCGSHLLGIYRSETKKHTLECSDEQCNFVMDNDTKWAGIEFEEVAHLAAYVKELVNEYAIPKKFASINFDKALRFNQGDAFFAVHAEQQIPATLPGDSKTPAIIDMLKSGDEQSE